MSRTRILVVDDEPNILASLKKALGFEGYSVEVAGGVGVAREKLAREVFDAAIVDVGLPDGSGLDLVDLVKRECPSALVLVMSGQATIERAVEAVRRGASDFLEKPLSTDRLLVTLENGLSLSREKQEKSELLRELGLEAELLGSSRAMTDLRALVARAARSRATVLIRGERGTGKELVARALHRGSERAARPLEKLNCAAVPENLIESELFGHEAGAFTGATKLRRGKFERADRGTLFLDEVGDMPSSMQAKLLRVLQEEEIERIGGSESLPVDVRILAATNRDLEAAMRDGLFRPDLFDRLNVLPLELPPLRARRDDIPELARHFVLWAAERSGRGPLTLTDDAASALARHPFPGNVRELKNLIERLVILAPDDTIDAADVTLALGTASPTAASEASGYRPGVPLRVLVEEAERAILERAIAAHGGQMAATARALGLERSHLYKKAKALGLRGGEDPGEGA